jgi:hypothetical protein
MRTMYRYDIDVTKSDSDPLTVIQVGDEQTLMWKGERWALFNPAGHIQIFRPDDVYVLRIYHGIAHIVPLPGSNIHLDGEGQLVFSLHEVFPNERRGRVNPLLVENDHAIISATATVSLHVPH